MLLIQYKYALQALSVAGITMVFINMMCVQLAVFYQKH